MKRFVTALLTLYATLAQADSVSPVGLCAPEESIFFACQTTGRQWINLCGNLPETLQYRFGSTGKVELRFPENAAKGMEKLMFAHYWRFQTDRMEIVFNNKNVDYAVFDYNEDGKRNAGIRVTTADGKEKEFVCFGPITSRLRELDKVLRCDPDNALNGGSCPQ